MQVRTKVWDTCSVYGWDWTLDPKAELSNWRVGLQHSVFLAVPKSLDLKFPLYYASAELGTWDLNTKPPALPHLQLPRASQMGQTEPWYLLTSSFWLMPKEGWATLCKHWVKHRNCPATCQPLSIVLPLSLFLECWIARCIRFPL